MKKLLSVLAFSVLLLSSASTARAQISFGIEIGPPPPPRGYRVLRQPGPEFVWVEGYWYPTGGRYRWHDGYWTRPPYEGAYWVQPYYLRGQYFPGYWESRRGWLSHDHRWDRGRRDERRDGWRDYRR